MRELAARCDASAASASRAGDGGPRRLVIFDTPKPSYCVSGLERETGKSLSVRTSQKLLARTTEEGSRTLYYHGFPACHVTNDWGRRIQKKFFDDLLSTLEEIQPGISSNI
ncbi:hypothetical protein MYCTH_2124493 [Thermothelomyces thermophilus ATCC 42464]|uniref:Uncharacterized protein n=1 Tax=Thermothelomyces thermophilus (strain ATCC 42464 / BCRC 31852 / DSM 1799) TaxID=573729 RepID=G2Q671_THET4|nr:uncharacterized protein MYCTH_2124493 [Thermothelomyces thermophilus ATCC 42464]AEO55550.1 hypothetical protein MYCTH_2124493 [Thermothelomyces thermophilus ATCC 42464]